MIISDTFKKYTFNASWMIGGRLIKAFLNFSVGIFVARYLGPDRFGSLNYVIGVACLFSIFSAMGLDNVLVRELVSEKEGRRNILLGSGLCIKFIGALVALLGTALLLLVSGADAETWWLTLICATSFFAMPFDTLRSYFEAEVQGKKIVAVEMVQCICTSALRIYFIWIKADIIGFALCWLLEWVFNAIGFGIIYRLKVGALLKWRIHSRTIVYLLRESLPILFSAMAIVIYQQIDKVMLKNMLPEHGNMEVGYYSAALRFLPLAIIIPQMLSKAVAPALIEIRKKNTSTYYELVQLYMDLMFCVGLILSMGLFFFSGSIIGLYGTQYSEAGILLRIVAWKGLLTAMSISSGLVILVEGTQKWAVVRNVAGAIVNVLLNLLLIPIWGALGSAIATIISLSVASFFVHLFIPKYRFVFSLQRKSIWGGILRLSIYGKERYRLLKM